MVDDSGDSWAVSDAISGDTDVREGDEYCNSSIAIKVSSYCIDYSMDETGIRYNHP